MKLSTAKVCINCEEVFDPSYSYCPGCGSSNNWIFLSAWINRENLLKEGEKNEDE